MKQLMMVWVQTCIMFCWVMPISWLCDIFWLRRDHHSVLSTEEPVSCKCLRLLRWHAIAQFPRKRLLHDCSVKTQTAQMCIPISSPHWSWVLVLCHVADKTCVTLMHDTSTPAPQNMIIPRRGSWKSKFGFSSAGNRPLDSFLRTGFAQTGPSTLFHSRFVCHVAPASITG